MTPQQNRLLHEELPRYDPWIKIAMGLVWALTIIPGVWLFASHAGIAIILLAVAAIYTIVFYSILPRRFQIYEDRLVISLGKPFGVILPLKEVTQVRLTERSIAFGYRGIRMATSTRDVVEITSIGGLDIAISPKNATRFVERLNAARAAANVANA